MIIPVAWQEPVCDWTRVPLATECAPNAPNNLLDKFYEDPSRWGLTFQQHVIFSRVKEFYENKENEGPGYVNNFHLKSHNANCLSMSLELSIDISEFMLLY